MNFSSWILLIGYVVVAGLTFSVWLQPEPRTTPFRAGFAATMAVLFFLSSFALGVWISVMRAKGQLWIFSV